MVADENENCGVSPFSTSDSDIFAPACAWHDLQYRRKEAKKTGFSRKQVDEHFYKQMLEIAGDNWKLKLKARFYYTVARLFGGPLWKW